MLSGVAAETGTRFDGEAGGTARVVPARPVPGQAGDRQAGARRHRGTRRRRQGRRRPGCARRRGDHHGRGSILIVDDEYGVRSGIRTILEMEGYEVGEAGDGAGRARALDERDYDVALLDYRLPDTDGLSLLQTMKQRGLRRHGLHDHGLRQHRHGDRRHPAGRGLLPAQAVQPRTTSQGVVETLLRHKQARTEAERLRAEHEASLLALAEEKTQTHSLVSSLRDAVLVVNRDGDVVLANPPMLELLELGEDDVLMRPAPELLGGGALAPLGEQLAAPAKDRTVRQLELGEQA